MYNVYVLIQNECDGNSVWTGGWGGKRHGRQDNLTSCIVYAYISSFYYNLEMRKKEMAFIRHNKEKKENENQSIRIQPG